MEDFQRQAVYDAEESCTFWLAGQHLSEEEADALIAKISKCKKLVLTHFVPTKFNEKNLKKLIKKDYGKYPIIGKDLLTIKI